MERLLKAGHVVLCDMVILELWNGARGSSERSKLRQITETLDRVPTADAVWRMADNLATACRTQGITVPSTDLLIAATSRVHRLELLEADSHFRMIPNEGET
ncbi:MAG TPA: PIN domain-containing protein [Alkalispirochaeta sp.]|nr:PIN domain-containing protein [Alkalispirochaeta sp.]